MYTIVSGGANGADKKWEEVAKLYKCNTVVYTVNEYNNLLDIQKRDIELQYFTVVCKLNRNTIPRETYAGKLVRRDMLQANLGDSLFAIGSILNLGEKDSKGNLNKSGKQIISGGTAYATERAIQLLKPTFVFNQRDNNWYKWNYENNIFEECETPTLSFNSTCVGTRELSKEGEKAITDVFKKTFPDFTIKTNKKIDYLNSLRNKLNK